MPVIDRLSLYRKTFYGEPNDFTNPNVAEQYPPDLELEPVHLDIDLFVDVGRKEARGRVTTIVRARRKGPSRINLDAVDFLELVVNDADDRALTWSYDGSVLSVEWAEPFAAGEERRLAVSYRVVNPVDGLFFSQPNEQYPDQAWYAVTDHETERARHWLPCIDLPNVRTTLDFHLRAETRFTILANGYLVEETAHIDGTKTAHWRLEQRCPSYLTCFAIGDFVRADDGYFEYGDDHIELSYFCSREHDADSLLRSFGRTGEMMAWMTRKLDRPFPFPKYYQFALPQLGGAMENISLVSWDDNFIMDVENARELGWLVDIINIHEMSHSYFGDAVVVRDFAHAWLKESWATYMEQLWCEDNRGEDEAQYVFYDNAKGYFEEADEKYRRPIVSRRFKSSWQMYDRHLYPGGACRLHTLRRELGDEVFFPAVSDYLKRFDGQVVETDDFRQVMEEHSGRSLVKFFEQWFHSPGYPDIKVTFNYKNKEKQGIFVVEQKQVNLAEGVPTFELNTSLGWIVEGESHRLPIKLEEARQTFVVAMASEPEAVRFDPDYRILHKLSFNPGDTRLRHQLANSQDVIGRILAAHELAKSATRTNILAIVEAYTAEPFWGAREEFARALAEAGTEVAIDGLAQIVTTEQDPMVLPAVFRAAGKFRDVRLRDAISQRLHGELPPLARKAAYEAMGNQRKLAHWDLLLEGTRHSGYNGHAQSGAFSGLAASRREEATQILLEQIPYGVHSNRVRPAIVSGLADIAKGLEKTRREEVVELLSDLLRDPWLRVRMRVVTGLTQMGAVEAIPALEAFSRAQSQQAQVYHDKQIERLRMADKSDGSALKKQVEDMQTKLRKLEGQLQSLQAKAEATEKEND